MRGWDFMRMYVAYRKVHTDARGRFAFGDVASGTYNLVVYDRGNRKLGQRKGIRVDAGTDPDEIKMTIDR